MMTTTTGFRLPGRASLRCFARPGLSILGGSGFVLALPPFSILPLAFASFAILALLLRQTSTRGAFGLGYLFGLGQFLPGLFWITESFQVESDRFGWLAVPAVIGLAGFLSVFPAMACGLAVRGTRYGMPPALSLASSWTILEWMRGHVLTGFPWNLAAYTLADWTIARQAASLVGSYGLGFLFVLCASLAGLSLVRADRYLARDRVAGVCVILITVIGFGLARLALSSGPAERATQLRIVQPNIPQSSKWDEAARNANILKLLLLSARPGQFDLLLWPETAWPGFLEEDTAARSVLSWLLPQNGVLLTGSPERQLDGDWVYRNSVLAIGPDGSILTRYAKHHLVPFGEYVPWRNILPFPRLVQSLGDFTPGPGPRTLAIGPHPYVGVAICYEAIFPGHVVDDAIRPDWIFNATNDAWFGNSIGPWQHLASARMRAVEEGLPLVRAANTGISVVVDPYGRTQAMLGIGITGIIDTRLPRALTPTLYARLGDWSVVALVLLSWVVVGSRDRLKKLTLLRRKSE